MCTDCNREVRSESCYTAHKLKRRGTGRNSKTVLPSLCEENYQCSDCGTSLKQNNKDKHECGEVKCFVCAKTYMSHEEHLCYLRAKSSDIEPEKFIFYDFECTQESGNHVPNFVVAQSICP